MALAEVGTASSPSPATPTTPSSQTIQTHSDRLVSWYSGQSPERSYQGIGLPRRSAAPAVTAPSKQGNDSAREAGHTSVVRPLGMCWNCNKPGHYADTCPEPKKPRESTPTRTFDKSRTQYPGGSRTANVATHATSAAEKRVEFSTGGAIYWPALMAVRKADTRWIRRDQEYLIKNNFLMEDVVASVPGPNILLS